MTFYIIISFSAFFISLVGTKLVILTLRKQAARPDIDLLLGRRKELPYNNGGIAVVFALIIGFLGADPDIEYTIITSIFLLTGLPLLSGIMPVARKIKLLVYVAAVLISLSNFPTPIFSYALPPLLDKTLSGFLWLWLIHSFERMEKVEGLIPVQMISIGLGLSALTILSKTFFMSLSIQALVFATTGFGFYWWNRHPAKILPGPIASSPIGFAAGYLLLLAAHNGYESAILILPAYFLADSMAGFFSRIFSYKKSKIKKPDPYCLRAIKASKSPAWIVRLLTGINMLLAFLEAQILINPEMIVFYLVIAYAMVFTLMWFFSRMDKSVSL
jgi:UDP-N-acetylmuramyl pentapeptide phosphotransferase/UDP-N-acetylglucosamine-1-phosphate transferase